MKTLKNPRHEKFAQLLASGEPAAKAYQKVYKGTKRAAEAHAHRLVENEGVKGRVRELQQETATKLSMTRHELAEFLIEVIRTPAGKITANHRLCQSVKNTEFGLEIRIPDKLGAASQLAKLCGWNEPEKQDIGGDGLAQLVAAIRARR